MEKKNQLVNEYYSLIRSNKLRANKPSIWQEFTLGLIKERNEPLGVVVEGGSSPYDDENIPLFVSYVEPKSFMDKTKHIRVDIIRQKIIN